MTIDQVNERALLAGLRTDESGAVWGHVSALHRYSLQLVRDAAQEGYERGSRAALEQQRRPGFDQVDEGDYDLGLDGKPNKYRP